MKKLKKSRPTHNDGPPYHIEPFFRTGWPEITRMFDFINRDFDRVFPNLPTLKSHFESILSFPYDILDEGDKFLIIADMPGVKKEEITLNLTENNVEISVKHIEAEEETKKNYLRKERKEISHQRSFPFPEKVDPTKAKAKLENGVLRIDIPKLTPTPQPESTSVPIE